MSIDKTRRRLDSHQMTRVVVDQDITPTAGIEEGLPNGWDIDVGIGRDTDEVIAALDGADILLTTSRIKVTREVLSRSHSLQLVGKIGTGIDNVDLEAARELGIPVTYTPGYNALSVAELGLGLMLGAARRYTEARKLLEDGRWRDELSLGKRISGTTVGIVGLGNVGKRFAQLLTGFHANIVYSDPYIPPIDGEIVGADPVALDALLETSDFVVLMPELTAETTGLIGHRELSLMQDDAILVNTARGTVVDEKALIEALEKDEIGGAGLDVYEVEPLDASSPLLSFDQVVTTPHIGAMTHADRTKTITELTHNVIALTRGDPVDPSCLAVSPDI